MSVTARLLGKFRNTFGHEIADELAEWFSQVDTRHRAELRQMFETGFSRFDAKFEQRIAEVKAELRQELTTQIAAVRAEMHAGFASQTRWNFAFWTANTLTVVGTLIALLKF